MSVEGQPRHLHLGELATMCVQLVIGKLVARSQQQGLKVQRNQLNNSFYVEDCQQSIADMEKESCVPD